MTRKSETRHRDSCLITYKGRIRAFTFIEVMLALAIVSISLMALLRLHLMGTRMVENAQTISQAVFLADEKMAETVAVGFPEEGIRSGAVQKNGLTLNWETHVENLQSSQIDVGDIGGLRKVLVDVSWKQGSRPKHLRMSTYIADRTLP